VPVSERQPYGDYPGFGIANECRQSTAPIDIKHHESHSGGCSTFRGAANVPEVAVKKEVEAGEELPVRSARNFVACGLSTYALT
jgi:hypothetical protein